MRSADHLGDLLAAEVLTAGGGWAPDVIVSSRALRSKQTLDRVTAANRTSKNSILTKDPTVGPFSPVCSWCPH
jgi:phosphohistidine phosphatase SixA